MVAPLQSFGGGVEQQIKDCFSEGTLWGEGVAEGFSFIDGGFVLYADMGCSTVFTACIVEFAVAYVTAHASDGAVRGRMVVHICFSSNSVIMVIQTVPLLGDKDSMDGEVCLYS